MKSVGIWGLREESLKYWDHFVSDKVVYLLESGKRNLEGTVTDKYLNGNTWFEVHFTRENHSQGEDHFKMVIERASRVSRPTC